MGDVKRYRPVHSSVTFEVCDNGSVVMHADHAREVDAYRETIAKLEQRLGDMQDQFDRIAEKGLEP